MPRIKDNSNRRRRFGNIYQLPGGQWRARYSLYGDSETKNFGSYEQAEHWLDDIKRLKRNGSLPNDLSERRIKFDDFVTVWLKKKNREVSPKTFVNYESIVNGVLIPRFGHMRVCDINVDHTEAWIEELLDAGKLSPETIRKFKMVLSQVFHYAMRRDLIIKNPCEFIRINKGESKEMMFLTHEEVLRLSRAIPHPYGMAVRLAAYSGLRAGEIWDAKIKSLDFDRGILQIVSTASEVSGKLITRPAPKNGQWRASRVGKELMKDLTKHAMDRSPEDFIFLSQLGYQVRHRNFSKRLWEDAKADAKINPKLRFHDLRHTCAAFHFKAGASSEEVRRILGHGSIQMTHRYAHIFPEAFGGLVDLLDADIADAQASLEADNSPSEVIVEEALSELSAQANAQDFGVEEKHAS